MVGKCNISEPFTNCIPILALFSKLFIRLRVSHYTKEQKRQMVGRRILSTIDKLLKITIHTFQFMRFTYKHP